MNQIIKRIAALLLPVIFCLYSAGQNTQSLTTIEKRNIIDTALGLLKQNYIFPEKAKVVDNAIQKKWKSGHYDTLTAREDFLKAFNHDLELFSNDRHVNIFLDPVRVQQIRAAGSKSDNPVFAAAFLERVKFENYMVRTARRLEGNIGYLKFDQFVDLRLSKPTLVAAMNFLNNSNAIIVDLTENGGGNANTVHFLVNYFLPDSAFLSEFYSRLTNTTTPIFTEGDPLINKFTDDIPLYILTSKRTSSAAEAFAYTLQSFKRAVVVGDTSNGEANPGYPFAINDDLWMMIPTSVNKNAITKTNWQGVGVIPDVNIPSSKALSLALTNAYETLAKRSNPRRKYNYEWLADATRADVEPIPYNLNDLKSIAGDYADERHIQLENGDLFYYRKNASGKKKLIPLRKDLFMLDGVNYFRVRIVRNEKLAVVAMEGLYDDGNNDRSARL